MSNFNRCHGAGDVVRLSEINTELSVCRVVGSATGKQQIADFSVYGNSANTHILLYGNGNDNSANWINTSGSEKLILGDGNNPDTMAVTGGNVGIGTTSPGAKLDVNGNVKIGSSGAFYLGDANTDGSWRFTRSGNNLVFQRRESSTWVTKSTISA